MQSSIDKYLREHSTIPSESLDWIEKQTNIHTNYPRMLSGSVQGELLKILVEISGARMVLEIGSFTGYSAACMALGLPDDGHVDALEINDELEELMRAGWERTGVADKITLHIGDARRPSRSSTDLSTSFSSMPTRGNTAIISSWCSRRSLAGES